ncbi:Hsp20/alpha crystallin family protein [Eleftheria terrae]|uniref:Hsp20/alpha crystallin family protein n=1 Tax=Eleftheria terrae TaxID=1597781 RepID=UPI00263B1774|nr:Hsp20/alpha crystallin family protein [Eleftheria terrae]WKB53143.1 Hsp20/alpha crystallin family protein [Eleftheria terrae]
MYESMLSFPAALFGEFDRLRREMEDVVASPGLPASIRSVAPGSFPAINIGRTPSSVEIYAFAPGIDASSIDLTLDRGVLTMSGERRSPLPEEGQQRPTVYSRERVYGSFRRAVTLPDDIDPTQVQATYRDGVLRVSIARREAAQPKRIAVQ